MQIMFVSVDIMRSTAVDSSLAICILMPHIISSVVVSSVFEPASWGNAHNIVDKQYYHYCGKTWMTTLPKVLEGNWQAWATLIQPPCPPQSVPSMSLDHATATVTWTWFGLITVSSVWCCQLCLCPCNNGSTAEVPPYVGSDYYCELATMLLVLYTNSFQMLPCGMGSSVMVWRLPAVLIPRCHGSSRHSMRPPPRIFSWGCVRINRLLMKKLYCSWSHSMSTDTNIICMYALFFIMSLILPYTWTLIIGSCTCDVWIMQ